MPNFISEDDIEIYDSLCKDKMSQEDEKRVRLAAKELLKPHLPFHS